MNFLITLVLMLGIANVAVADQSASEKAAAKANDAKRTMKKKIHQLDEAVCAEGDTKCLSKKAKHRTEEGGDYMKDKTEEAIDKVDSGSKPN